MHGDAVQEMVIIANDYVFVNDTERTDDVVVAEYCLGINDGHWMYLIHKIRFSI